MTVTPDPDPLQCVSRKLGNVKEETFSCDKQLLVKKLSRRLSWGFVASILFNYFNALWRSEKRDGFS